MTDRNTFQTLPTSGRAAACRENSGKKHLLVMKFGGTSMNGGACIQQVASIVKDAAQTSNVAVVVSAMSGVTDQLLEAAAAAEARNRQAVTDTLDELRVRHLAALAALVRSAHTRQAVAERICQILEFCSRICEAVIAAGELTLAERDAIAGAGERMSAPLLAAALVECGVPSEPVDATGLIVTDGNHSAAEPLMSQTREYCAARLAPLLSDGIVPVITGYIGATTDRVPTTLGRGGSDYSATIIASAVGADEVVIWTDVDGFMTADPNVVLGARLIPELSYGDASDLAQFGAKVLHSKTLGAVKQSGLPLWIRKTFAPEATGTKIVPNAPEGNTGVKALTSTERVTFITLEGSSIASSTDIVGRAVDTVGRICQGALLITGVLSKCEIAIACARCDADIVGELVREFERELDAHLLRRIQSRADAGLVTAVGANLNRVADRARQTVRDIGVRILFDSASKESSRFSIVVPARDVSRTIVALHTELVERRTNERERAAHRTLSCAQSEAYGPA
jgi:bifunctional aspartokinase / homoserine dehydrogenase 1